MKFNVVVNGSGYDSQTGFSAYKFTEAALQAGHEIEQVFFYRDGVSQANAFTANLSDEFDPVNSWVNLATKYDLDLYVCVSAAERRGVIDGDQQQEFDKSGYNLHAAFKVAGLGVLLDASLNADRTITFR